MIARTPLLLALGAVVLLGGCVAAPVRRAAPPAPVAWTVTEATTLVAALPEDWWTAFREPALDALVAQALRNNADLAGATLRLRAARELARDARLGRGPSGGVAGGILRTRIAAASQPPFEGQPAEFPTQRLVDAGLELRWQADLAGAQRGAARAADADAAVAEWQARQLRAGLVAAVVDAWLDADGAARAQARLARRVAALASVDAALARGVTVGTLREDERAPVTQALEQSRAEASLLGLRERDACRRLSTLVGGGETCAAVIAVSATEAADATNGDKTGGSAAPRVVPATLPVIDPARLLALRPDVGAAEARVQAAFARAGAARAALYPQVVLAGTLGLTGPAAQLDEGGAVRFGAGPALSWGLFDLPRLQAQARAAGALAEADVAGFHAATLAALEEADGAIDRWRGLRGVSTRTAAAAAAAGRAADVAVARQRAGLGRAVDAAAALADAEAWTLAALDAEVAERRAWATALLALGAGAHDTD
jgi:outer membrane protein TolC